MIFIQFILVVGLMIVLFAIITIISLLFKFRNIIYALLGKKPKQRQHFNPFGQSGTFTQGGTYSSGAYTNSGNGRSQQQTQSGRTTVSGNPKPRHSEIDKNEGEYVEFEEL